MMISLLVFLAGCGGVQNKSDAGSEQQEKMVSLKIGILSVPDILPLVVGIEKGYYEQAGINLELIPFQSAVERESALQAGHLDGVITDMIVAYLLKAGGVPVKITSITSGVVPSEGRFGIASAPNSNITSLGDLQGKRVGISHNTIIEYVLDGLLEQSGLDESHVEKIPVPKIPVRLEMLMNGQLDAAVLPDPFLAFAEFAGASVVADDTTGDNLSQVVLVFHGDVLENKFETLKRFYQGYVKAIDDINSDREQYRELFVKEARVPEAISESYTVPVYPKPSLPAKDDMERVYNWLANKGVVTVQIPYEDMIVHDLY